MHLETKEVKLNFWDKYLALIILIMGAIGFVSYFLGYYFLTGIAAFVMIFYMLSDRSGDV